MKTLTELRQDIENIDADIIRKLAEREKVSKEIGEIKKASKSQVQDIEREQKLEQLYESLSEQYGLSASFVKTIFQLIISHSRNIQA